MQNELATSNEATATTQQEPDNQGMIQDLLEGETPEAKIAFYTDWLREMITTAGGQTAAAKLINKYTCGFAHDRTTLGKFLKGNGNNISMVTTTILLRAALDSNEENTNVDSAQVSK